MPPCFLVTRPLAEAQQTAARLHQLGFEAILAPMVVIQPIAINQPLETGYQALLITSRHGLNQWAGGDPTRDKPVFCVGEASATLAHQLGYRQVITGNGNASQLEPLVAAALNPANGALLHPTGEGFVAEDWVLLRHQGFAIHQPKLYRQIVQSRLDDGATTALQQQKLSGVLFYAPQTAGAYQRAVIQAGLGDLHQRLSAICLSPAVASVAAESLNWQRILIANHLNEAGLLDRLVELWRRT
jgi:uroporphyrinogen-III synthase